ncbi:MAG: hypothetical protein ACWGPS_02530 [Candidatus Promineifilaceae bacterium]
MKKAIISVLAALVLLSTATVGAFAAPPTPQGQKTEPFEGTFRGTVYGSEGSSAFLTLNLSQTGKIVEGDLLLGSGLYVDGGFCGGGYVPSGTQSATGKVVPDNPNRLTADSTFKVNGMNIKVRLTGDTLANGNALKARATVDLPWLCGQDPQLSGTLYRTK